MTKNGLRSFAGGLIVATLIMSYMYYFQLDEPETDRELTQEEVERYARENNLIVLTEEELKETSSHDEKDEQENKKDQNPQEETNQAEKEQPEETKQVKEVNVEIKPGMSTDSVAAKLHELKLIPNKDDFTRYIKKQKLEASVKAGTFQLNNQMSIEEIAAILTK